MSQAWIDKHMAAARDLAIKSANNVPPFDFFDVKPGDPGDECLLCHIKRRHAGNPAACSRKNFARIGCFVHG